MNFFHLKINKRERGREISLTTPVGTCRLYVVVGRRVCEVSAAAVAECDVVVRDVIFLPSALLASLRLHFLHLRHRLAAAPSEPPGLLAEDSRIGLEPLLTDVFPLRPMIQAPAVNTLAVGILLSCKVTMVHSNPPFWPPVFLGAAYIIHKTIEKSIVWSRNKKSALSLILKSNIGFLKNFSFLLLTKSGISFCSENSVQFASRAARNAPRDINFSYVVPRERVELS
jgi:hypothetical protein